MPGKMARWSLGFDMDRHGSRQCSPRPSRLPRPRAPPGPRELPPASPSSSLAALAPLRQALLPLQGLAGSSGALLDSAEPFRGDGPTPRRAPLRLGSRGPETCRVPARPLGRVKRDKALRDEGGAQSLDPPGPPNGALESPSESSGGDTAAAPSPGSSGGPAPALLAAGVACLGAGVGSLFAGSAQVDLGPPLGLGPCSRAPSRARERLRCSGHGPRRAGGATSGDPPASAPAARRPRAALRGPCRHRPAGARGSSRTARRRARARAPWERERARGLRGVDRRRAAGADDPPPGRRGPRGSRRRGPRGPASGPGQEHPPPPVPSHEQPTPARRRDRPYPKPPSERRSTGDRRRPNRDEQPSPARGAARPGDPRLPGAP